MKFEGWAQNRRTVTLPVHQSHVKTACHCKREYWFRYRAGMVPAWRVPGDAITNGKLVHSLLANHFLRRTEGEGLAECGVMIEEWIERWSKTPGSLRYSADDQRKHYAKMLALSKAMVDSLLTEWRLPDRFEVMDIERSLTCESDLLPPVKHSVRQPVKVELEGTLDLVLRDRNTGGLWVWDHKTLDAQGSVAQYKRTCLFDPQTWIYRQLAKENARDLWGSADGRVVGFVFCTLKRPTIRQAQKETYDQYLERVKDWYLARGKYKDKQKEWMEDPPMAVWEQPIHPMQTIPEDVQRNIAETSELSKAYRPERFPRSTPDACFKYGRWCDYMPLCEADVLDYDRIITNTYRVTDTGRDD